MCCGESVTMVTIALAEGRNVATATGGNPPTTDGKFSIFFQLRQNRCELCLHLLPCRFPPGESAESNSRRMSKTATSWQRAGSRASTTWTKGAKTTFSSRRTPPADATTRRDHPRRDPDHSSWQQDHFAPSHRTFDETAVTLFFSIFWLIGPDITDTLGPEGGRRGGGRNTLACRRKLDSWEKDWETFFFLLSAGSELDTLAKISRSLKP
jgi:hypothetical protein